MILRRGYARPIMLHYSIHFRLPVEVPEYLYPSCLSHSASLLRMYGESNQSKCQAINEGLFGGGLDKNSTRRIDIVERSTPCRRNDGYFHRHGFEYDGAATLVHARKYQ